MIETKKTFCRICEASCGLIADIEDGKIINLAPNKEHIGTQGFACMKGLNQHKMYDSPDRLKYPLKRVGESFERISWSQALAEIGNKVKQLRQQDKNSISMYVGTAAGFSILHPIFAEGFMQGVGSHNVYSSATQDCANRFATSTEMYGFPFHSPFVDLDHVKCMIVVGTNPVVSKWTFLQVAHPVKRLKEVVKRGADLIFIDPRKTESASLGTGYHPIRPNTDVFFFLSFLHELFLQDGIDHSAVKKHMSGLEAIKRLAQAWPAEVTEQVTTIPADQLKQLVQTYIKAGASAIVTGTGVGMGKNGTLAHWLAECINAVSGNLDKKGGLLVGEGIFDFASFAEKNGLFSRDIRSRVGSFQQLNGAFPGGILADEILTPGEGQIKALFVSGGNPLLSMPNSERLKSALESLEMLVITDIYLNETASIADYVLPATSPLQRPDLPFIFPLFLGMQSKPYLAATQAIVEPDAEQRDESSIYLDLAIASGINLFDSPFLQVIFRIMAFCNKFSFKHRKTIPGVPQRFIMDCLLRFTGHGRFKDMLQYSNGKPWQGAQAGTLLGQRVKTKDGILQLAPDMFLQQSDILPRAFDDEINSLKQGELRLITKRVHSTHNSWTQNIEELTHGKMGHSNYLYMHPQDALAHELKEGDAADITSQTGSIRLAVKFLNELMPGTVAVQHGWGHQQAKGLSVASAIAGANVNILASDGPNNVEKVSGMAHLTGIPVKVTAAPMAINTTSWSGI